MRRGMTLIVAVVASATVLAGCRSAGTENDRRDCLTIRAVQEYVALDDHHVFIDAGGRDEYLLTLEARCNSLGFAHGLTLSDPTGRVCADGTSFLRYTLAGAEARQCRVINVEPVADLEAAKALLESRGAHDNG